MLANPRYWGVGFNPVSFYFLYGAATDAVEAMIAEVTSTPWKERRSYVLTAGADGLRGDFEKRMHVSPVHADGAALRVERDASPASGSPSRSATASEGRIVFEAGLALERREMTPAAMREILFRYPPMTVSTIARIYWNAARLKAQGRALLQAARTGAD